MTTARFKSAMALVLAFTTLASITVSPILAAGNAQFGGRVLQADGVTPHTGVVIVLLDTEEQEFRSAPTGDEGAFDINSAPAGTYMLLAETPEGAFLASDQLVLKEGSNTPLSLTLGTRTPAQLAEMGIGAGAGTMSRALKWTVIGLIGAGSFYVVNEVVDDVDPASDF